MTTRFFNNNIRSLDLAECIPLEKDEISYFRYYGINFEEKITDLKHYFGAVPCAGFNIACHYFQHPQSQACCFIVHGYYDHSGLYKHLINYCLKNKYSVIIFDLPGHGLSSGDKACIGNFANYQTVLNDVLDFFLPVIKQPIYAIGQSTGGAVLMDYLLSKSNSVFDKTILLAPLLRPHNWMLSVLMYGLVKPFLSKITRRFAVNSHDQDFLDFLKHEDPLQHRFLSLQWVGALKQWIAYFLALGPVDAAPLILQGKDDTTVDWRFNIPAIKAKFPRAKIIFIDDARHHLASEGSSIRAVCYKAMDNYLLS